LRELDYTKMRFSARAQFYDCEGVQTLPEMMTKIAIILFAAINVQEGGGECSLFFQEELVA
jgi:hypothetical protein